MKEFTRYSPEVRERAVRLVFEHEGEYSSQWSAIGSIAGKIDCSAETLRKWVRRAETDAGRPEGLTPRPVLEKSATMQIVDVHLPTTDGRYFILPRTRNRRKASNCCCSNSSSPFRNNRRREIRTAAQVAWIVSGARCGDLWRPVQKKLIAWLASKAQLRKAGSKFCDTGKFFYPLLDCLLLFYSPRTDIRAIVVSGQGLERQAI